MQERDLIVTNKLGFFYEFILADFEPFCHFLFHDRLCLTTPSNVNRLIES